ncbi:MAG: lamin tail domain-containing protein, partial [Candidatus Sumerlaeia bacterium]|nr:lamin tail domain-containing protein [Candidatus Sumerlaeia bacterium]
ASVFVSEELTGPTITLVNPAPDGSTTLSNPGEFTIAGSVDMETPFLQAFIDLGERDFLVGQLTGLPSGEFELTRSTGSYARTDTIGVGSLPIVGGTLPVRVIASTGPNGSGIVSEVSTTVTIEDVPTLPILPGLFVDGNATDILGAAPTLAVSDASGPNPGSDTADFGADGTLTELRAVIRDETLYVVIRGDMFGPDNDNFANGSFLLVDVNAGSGEGATNIAADLDDFSDGLRSDISAMNFVLSGDLVASGHGIDLVVGFAQPGIAFGYTMGSDGLPGSFDNFEFQQNIVAAYDSSVSGVPGAAGTTYAAPNALEIAIPLAVMGNPDPRNIRLAAVTASNAEVGGFPSPNTLPENSSNDFTPTQVIEEMAALPFSESGVVINEISVGEVDRLELFNPDPAPVALGGWLLRIYDSAGIRADFVIPDGVTIPADGFLVFAEWDVDQIPTSIEADLYTGFNIPWHPTRGGAIALIDHAGIGRDYVAWRNQDGESSTVTGVIPPGTTFTGQLDSPRHPSAHTLARDGQGTDTDTADDWTNTSGVDSDGPTFGAPNIGGTLPQRDQWMIY